MPSYNCLVFVAHPCAFLPRGSMELWCRCRKVPFPEIAITITPSHFPSAIAKTRERIIFNGVRPKINPQLDECQAGFKFDSDVQAYALLETLTQRENTAFSESVEYPYPRSSVIFFATALFATFTA